MSEGVEKDSAATQEVVKEVEKDVAGGAPVNPALAGLEQGEVGKSMLSTVRLFAMRFMSWMSIYAFGFFNISFGWLLAPLLFSVMTTKKESKKKFSFDVIRSIANTDEKQFIQAIQRHAALPAWVNFPDMEKVEWVNQIVYKLWPYAGQYVEDLVKQTIEPAIADALKEYKMGGFKFDKIILGDTPPRFGGIKVYDDTSRHEIILDADMVYAGDCKFEISVSKIKAGIKDLQIAGRVRVVMTPLVRQIPLVGGVQVFFLNNPELDFNLLGIADVFDMPGISDILRNIVIDQIAALMVLPNRFPLQLVDNINVVQLKCPMPAGVVRVEVVEAQNLMRKDVGILGSGKSDPYCVVRLGAQKYTTKTISNTVNPRWNFCCELLVNSAQSQELELVLHDTDDLGSDETLGKANIDVQMIWKEGEVDMWVPLSQATSGRVHVRATWLDLCADASILPAQLSSIRERQSETKNPLHSAVLLVWVDCASKLNPVHKQIPDAFVRVVVGATTHESTVRMRTNDPVFEEGFVFMVRSPLTQEVLIEVVDQRTSASQGRVQLDLNPLLARPDLALTETYALAGAVGGRAEIRLSMTLRILKKGSPNLDLPAPISAPAPLPPTATITSTPGTIDAVDAAAAPAQTVAEEQPPQQLTAAHSVSQQSLDDGVDEGVEDVVQRLEQVEMVEGGVVRQRLGSTLPQPPRIQLSIKASPRNTLVVVVHRITGLPVEADGELPDCYVKLYLLPDRTKDTKKKAGPTGVRRRMLGALKGLAGYSTDVIKDSCNPVYDERFEYPLAPSELTQRSLLVSVVDKKGFFRMQKSNVVGQVILDCGLLDPSSITQWYNLQPEMDEGED